MGNHYIIFSKVRKFMEINYHSTSTLLFPFTLASRHFQVAFSKDSPDKVQALKDQGIISYASSTPISLLGRIKHIIFGALECIPLIGIVVAFIDRFFNGATNPFKEVISSTPKFAGYAFAADPKVHLTDISVRPANLFYEALFVTDNSIQPGSGELFAFPYLEHERELIEDNRDTDVITVSAGETKTDLYRRDSEGNLIKLGEQNLKTYLGTNEFQISGGEIKEILKSQKVWLSPLISKKFYLELKEAMKKDGVVTLPGNDGKVPTLDDLLLYDSHVSTFLREVEKNPAPWMGAFSFEELKKLTVYQVGAMVVKTENYYSLVEDGYRLASRKVGDQDAIKLISACGIRGFFNTHRIPGNEQHQIDRKIMTANFKTAFQSIGKDGFAVFPAVGMGVWKGDPDIYWRAFFDAVLEGGNNLKQIFVNPGHQTTPAGKYKGCKGDEFATILAEYCAKYPDNKNLKKVNNLLPYNTDLFLLARNLKKKYPDHTVALFNASDPDVTLGNHVGEYVNNLCHPSTTEENYAAAGTSGLGFEGMTGVLEDPENRVIQLI